MVRPAAMLIVLLLLGACEVEAQSVSAPGSRSAAGFQWPVPSRVRVTEKTVRRRREELVHYTVVLERAKDGESLILKCRDFKFEKLAGREVVAGQKLGPGKALSSTIPDLILDQKGHVIRTEDLDDALARTFEDLGHTGSEEEMAQVRSLVGSPGFRERMSRRSTLFWDRWVGVWRGARDLRSGAKTRSKVSLKLGETDFPAWLTVSHEGPAAGNPGYVVLRGHARVDDDAGRKIYGKVLASRSQGRSARFTPEMLTSFLLTRSHEAVIEPGTLRPLTVQSEEVLELRINGGRPRRQTETHRYTFSW